MIKKNKKLKPIKLFTTKEQVVKLGDELHEGIKEKLKELDRWRRESYRNAHNIWFD